ncbi:MAG TPA: hypothetical protein VLS27_16575 [Gammaproteobacteria bacterium]|nr:hypothetical protein [Gammaproteobacteria bacterium]
MVQRYLDWLDHNELELAPEALELPGEADGVSPVFREYLLEAAKEMNLADHAEREQEKIAG